MEQGLDELIESLLTKIAFSGLEGLSAQAFVKAVSSFYGHGNAANDNQEASTNAQITEGEIAHASIVWRWVTKRKDVIVTPKEAELRPLEDLIPRAKPPSSSESSTETPAEQSNNEVTTTADAVQDEIRLFLSEERQWRAIAGHGPDYKRIPVFEWKALVAIASVGTTGILQGDLTRLTGQDKRSLPTRTDALARKGYIIKKQTMLRGCKTSKLWLAQFSESVNIDDAPRGLPDDVLNLPAAEITKNWNPVTFKHYYDVEPLNHLAISQAFLLILKAYSAMRYCDLRGKMKVEGNTTLMRALAKSSRWWAKVGVIRFEPMQSKQKAKVFKDCLKYIRDPTPKEWVDYVSTPKANLKIPSSRQRDKKKRGRSKKAESVEVTPSSSQKAGKAKKLAKRPPPSADMIKLSVWDPYKPLTTTFYEIIKRAGKEGTSNTELGMFNLGWPYRKFISTLTTLISLPRSLPPHLQPFAVHSDFERIGKTMTYKFYTPQIEDAVSPEHPVQSVSGEDDTALMIDGESNTEENPFPDPPASQFMKPGARVRGYRPVLGFKATERANLKRDHGVENGDLPPKKKRGRIPTRVREESSQPDRPPSPPPAPGVYRGKKNSLDPFKSKGRPRNSIVMRFVSPVLRDPAFFNKPRPNVGIEATPVPDIASQSEKGVETPIANATLVEVDTPPAQPKQKPGRGRASGNKQYVCDKCGQGYKNINGLEYHQKKSQTTCNPDWQPPPLPPPPAITARESEQRDVEGSQKSPSPAKSTSTPKPSLPSRRPKLAVSAVPLPTQSTTGPSRGVIVKPVAVHGVLDVPTASKARDVIPSPQRIQTRRASAGNRLPLADASPRARTAATRNLNSTQEIRVAPTATGGQKLYGKHKADQDRKKFTIELVLRLLEQNDQVLPGDISLYCLVVATWSREVKYASVNPPEWKQFQKMVRSMELEHKISFTHFGKIMNGSLKPFSIVHKGYYASGSGLMPGNIKQKIDEVKNKCEELYPNPYFPTQVSLSEHETRICSELAKKHNGLSEQDSSSLVSNSQVVAGKISRLDYDVPAARPGPSGASGQKRNGYASDNSVRSATGRRRKRRRRDVPDFTSDDEDGRPVSRRGRLSNVRSGSDEWAIEIAPPGFTQALEASSSINFIAPINPATFERTNARTDELSEDDEDAEDDDGASNDRTAADLDREDEESTGARFTPIHSIKQIHNGTWPCDLNRAYFENHSGESFTAVGTFPNISWFQRQNLPQDRKEITDMVQLRRNAVRRELHRYGKFGYHVAAIEAWERSPEGVYLQNLGNIAPDHIFINLDGVEPDPVQPKPVVMEWKPELQLTVDDVPDEILDAESEGDDDIPQEQSYVVEAPRKRGKRVKDENGPRTRRFVKRSQGNWKHRVLFPITKRETGRWNKERAVGTFIGREKETELVVAIVIIRKLMGGVDRITDWGLFLRLYPEWSVAGIRKFWIRVTKERANYIEALSRKFEVAFLEAYEKGEVAPLDYEDLGNYNWRALIEWGMKLKTHNDVELPTTRAQFDAEYSMTEPKKDEEDWRELWFHFQTSNWDRLDAAASLPLALPITKTTSTSSPSGMTEADLQLARSWVRALCNNSEQATVGTEIREELLRRGNRDKKSLDDLLERAVTQLLESKVISRLFGKGLSQVFKINNHLEIRLKKQAHAEKFSQAVAFKAELDEAFLNGRDMHIPINFNDGSIMAMINLQAYGRVRFEDVNFPNIPFGFEPGNYEGRKFSKRYYLFEVKIVPTDRYISNRDLPLVTGAKNLPVPMKGPLGEIPIWCDFFGNLDRARWAQCLSVVAFAMSVKGPMSTTTSLDLLQPVIEMFEVQLIMNWLDGLGLLHRVSAGNGVTVSEWWWLVVGCQADIKGKGIEA
ncbi:hypothetical protein KJ359_002347 [Pestalotiopsis sp. 9143b]|nr:hypothetical protein KJ359_002347 [Pestalotiopsis sp. 9143b]